MNGLKDHCNKRCFPLIGNKNQLTLECDAQTAQHFLPLQFH